MKINIINIAKKIPCAYLYFCTIQIICLTAIWILSSLILNEQVINKTIIEGLFFFCIWSFMIGGINTIFIIILYFLNINKEILINRKACITESVLFYILNAVISFIIDKIPTEIKFYHHTIIADDGNIISSNAYLAKFWYTDEAQIIYVYAILFLFYVIKKYFIVIIKSSFKIKTFIFSAIEIFMTPII